jgi:hypothetical protein
VVRHIFQTCPALMFNCQDLYARNYRESQKKLALFDLM